MLRGGQLQSSPLSSVVPESGSHRQGPHRLQVGVPSPRHCAQGISQTSLACEIPPVRLREQTWHRPGPHLPQVRASLLFLVTGKETHLSRDPWKGHTPPSLCPAPPPASGPWVWEMPGGAREAEGPPEASLSDLNLSQHLILSPGLHFSVEKSATFSTLLLVI
ncbi:unnamed protein product [Rangifer tarandus platyrhynchus]|uniref:Uncharacterized protein n=1 Tax=Rangifer tarandus platyrhynchus TaxID=3082113 RepID=A0ABN8Z3H3_RANTA|nr:unnamed protein product [Rangifer tarandus platyrhynchus]